MLCFPWTQWNIKVNTLEFCSKQSHHFKHDASNAMNIRVNKTIKKYLCNMTLGIHSSDVVMLLMLCQDKSNHNKNWFPLKTRK